MKGKKAKEMARTWVMQEAAKWPGFMGAFFHGSVNGLSDDEILPKTSDLDIIVVFDGPVPSLKLGKFIYQGALLEVSYISMDELKPPEAVLGRYNLAGSFRYPSIIADPSGWLSQLQQIVSKQFAKRTWVVKRCAHARDKVLAGEIRKDAPLYDRVTAWAFTTGITTHVLLVAGLRNPTVRKRYVAVRKLLADYNRLDFHETLLDLLGCRDLTPTQVGRHLDAMAEVFDLAKDVAKTPFFFSSDITDVARPIAVDGSWELIEQGYHREAVFWIVATYCRCLKILDHDASLDLTERYTQVLKEMLADLGIRSADDLVQRTQWVKDVMPEIWRVAEAIIDANSEIED